jgi:hypothetical protein
MVYIHFFHPLFRLFEGILINRLERWLSVLDQVLEVALVPGTSLRRWVVSCVMMLAWSSQLT